MHTYAREAGQSHDGLHGDLLLQTDYRVPMLDDVVQESVEIGGLRYCEHVAQLMQEMAIRTAGEWTYIRYGLLVT